MEPVIAVDLGSIFTQLEARLQKDELHMAMFVTAVAKKTVEITQQQVSMLNPFVEASAALVGAWVHKATHLGIADIENEIEGIDLFKDLRNQTRAFAAHWVLDPALIKALG